MELTKENYFESREIDGMPIISNSALKYITPSQGGSDARFKWFLSDQYEREETKALSLGKKIHLFAEDPSNFVIADQIKPAPAITTVIDRIFAILKARNVPLRNTLDATDLLLQVANETGYQTRWKDETRTNKLKEEGTEYFVFLVTNDGKIILSAQDREKIEAMTSSIFNSDAGEIITNKSIESEKPILFEFEGVMCKSLIDKVKIGTNSWMEWDLKTTSYPISQFMGYQYTGVEQMEPHVRWATGAFQSFGYYRQRAFYKLAIDTMLGMKMSYSSNIIAVETLPPYEVRILPVSQKWMDVGTLEIKRDLTMIKQYLQSNGYFKF